MVRKLSVRWVRIVLALSPVIGAATWLLAGNSLWLFWVGSLVGVAASLFVVLVWPEHVFILNDEDIVEGD